MQTKPKRFVFLVRARKHYHDSWFRYHVFGENLEDAVNRFSRIYKDYDVEGIGLSPVQREGLHDGTPANNQ